MCVLFSERKRAKVATITAHSLKKTAPYNGLAHNRCCVSPPREPRHYGAPCPTSLGHENSDVSAVFHAKRCLTVCT